MNTFEIDPGPGDQLIFVSAGDRSGGNRVVTWLSLPDAAQVSSDRDAAVLRALLTLALHRLDQQGAGVR